MKDGTKANGLIDLDTITEIEAPMSESKKMFEFALHTTGRVYRLYAQTTAIREEWLNAISHFMKEKNPSFQIRRPESGSGSVPTINIFSAGVIITPEHKHPIEQESSTNKISPRSIESDRPLSDKPQPKIDGALDEPPVSLETPSPAISTSSERSESPFDVIEHHDAIQTGYLFKTPGKRETPGSWQRRWFILTSKRIIYYKNHVCGLLDLLFILID